MISSFRVRGFKSFQDLTFPMAKLTLLVGENGSGKSSLIQALLLLRQSINGDAFSRLQLSGDLFEAGTAQDVLNAAADYKIEFDWIENDRADSAKFEAKRTSRTGLSIRLLDSDVPVKAPSVLQGEAFTYLNAERWGPRLSTPKASKKGLAGPLGKFGEFSAAYLARSFSLQNHAKGWAALLQNECVQRLLSIEPQELKEAGEVQHRLVDLLLSKIVPGLSVGAQDHLEIDSAGIRYLRDPSSTRTETRPTHVGFGYSVALPVILGAFTAWKSAYIVENPEAHLHPRSQSLMGAFTAIACATLDQAIVETHSDHVLNGVRLAVKYGAIEASAVSILFFRMRGGVSEVVPITVNERGKLSNWPDGFFDQFERDLARL
jgi:predicted ATPase